MPSTTTSTPESGEAKPRENAAEPRGAESLQPEERTRCIRAQPGTVKALSLDIGHAQVHPAQVVAFQTRLALAGSHDRVGGRHGIDVSVCATAARSRGAFALRRLMGLRLRGRTSRRRRLPA